MLTKHTKAFSVVALVLAAAIFIYGLVDMQSYRAGYVSGYSTVSRIVDAACMKGDVLDADLCLRMEEELYADGGDGVYNAIALDSFGPSLVEKVSAGLAKVGGDEAPTASGEPAPAPKKRTRRSRRSAAAQAAPAASGAPAQAAPAAETPAAPAAPATPPPPPEPPKPKTSGQIAAEINCPGITKEADCKANALEPYCKWDIYDSNGVPSSNNLPRCRDTKFKVSMGGDVEGICAERSIKDRLPAAYKHVGTDPVTGQEVTVCISPINGRFVYATMPNETMSASEMLRVPALKAKGQAIGATVVAVTASASCPPPPAPGQPYQPMTPAQMAACAANPPPPMHMAPYMPPRTSAAPQSIFFASLIEIVRALWYAPR